MIPILLDNLVELFREEFWLQNAYLNSLQKSKASSVIVKVKMPTCFPKIALLIQIPIFYGSGSVINRSTLKAK